MMGIPLLPAWLLLLVRLLLGPPSPKLLHSVDGPARSSLGQALVPIPPTVYPTVDTAIQAWSSWGQAPALAPPDRRQSAAIPLHPHSCYCTHFQGHVVISPITLLKLLFLSPTLSPSAQVYIKKRLPSGTPLLHLCPISSKKKKKNY